MGLRSWRTSMCIAFQPNIDCRVCLMSSYLVSLLFSCSTELAHYFWKIKERIFWCGTFLWWFWCENCIVKYSGSIEHSPPDEGGSSSWFSTFTMLFLWVLLVMVTIKGVTCRMGWTWQKLHSKIAKVVKHVSIFNTASTMTIVWPTYNSLAILLGMRLFVLTWQG